VTARLLLGRLHRYLGLATAAFLVVAGLSGSVIAFDNELDAWLNPQLFRAEAGPALSASTLAARIEASDPAIRVAFIEVNVEPGRSTLAWIEPGPGTVEAVDYNQVFIDPATGTILGRRDYGACCLQRDRIIPFLYDLHRRLTMPGHWGQWLMGGVALLWLADCFIALALTLPRRLSDGRRWRLVSRIKLDGSVFRAMFDSHRAGGLWSWIVLLALAISSVSLNLGSEVVRPVVGFFSPIAPTPYERPLPRPVIAGEGLTFDQALARSVAIGRERGWNHHPTGLYLDREHRVYVTDLDDGRQLRTADAWLAIDADDGHIVGTQMPGDGSAGDIFLQLQLPIHSGHIAGLPGRILVCLTGIVVAGLSITGVLIWLRKRTGRP
jgi:uncharacterized iron-regulated membrane protein